MEQEFVQRLNELINKNLDNSDFSVEELAESLGVSRVQLYRKVKAMMGVSISDYVSNHRLEKAKSKLGNTQLTIAEVAYGCGFSSPSYFSTAFKNKYGVTPASYRRST
jgi:AraC-like DNA-binding protein